MRQHCEQLHANKYDNLDEMNKRFEKYKPGSLKKEEIDNGNNSITIPEIEFVFKNIHIMKTQGPEVFCGEIYQSSKEEIISFNTNSMENSKRMDYSQDHSVRLAYTETKTKDITKIKIKTNKTRDEYPS